RFHTVTVWPRASKRPATAWPIVPRPRTLTLISGSPRGFESSASRVHHRARVELAAVQVRGDVLALLGGPHWHGVSFRRPLAVHPVVCQVVEGEGHDPLRMRPATLHALVVELHDGAALDDHLDVALVDEHPDVRAGITIDDDEVRVLALRDLADAVPERCGDGGVLGGGANRLELAHPRVHHEQLELARMPLAVRCDREAGVGAAEHPHPGGVGTVE